MQIHKYPEKNQLDEILAHPTFDTPALFEKVTKIIEDVKATGDEAIISYTKEFDGVDIDNLLVQPQECIHAEQEIKPILRNAIDMARKNIHKFHYAQKEDINFIQTVAGVECWRKSVAIQKVGLYIPGGTAPLFSTVLMLGIPAQIAGCEEIIICTPPRKDGTIDPIILSTAKKIGINQVYKIGGAQAIAAMAFGTATIPKVHKIFGPGNQYVTAAKQLVSIEGTAIDMPAGPSELLVLADKTTEPEFIASDLLSQAEHGADSQVILVTFDETIVEKILSEIEVQLSKLPRKKIAEEALKHSKVIVVHDKMEAVEVINHYAPEHLIISVANEGYYIDKIKNAGSVFLGKYTPEAAGDYASGTNHTLPTNGHAKAHSGVSLDSFVKKITFQRITKDAILNLGPTIEHMAEAEQLHAHKNAVTIRIEKIRSTQMKKYDY